MENQLYNQLNPTTPMANNYQNNPQVMQMLNLVKQSGMSPKQLFMQKANEMGVNIPEVLKQAEQLASQFNIR